MIRATLKYKFWTEEKLDSHSKPSVHGFGFDNEKIVAGKIDITNVVKTGIEICGNGLEFTPFVFDEQINGCYAVGFVEDMINDLCPLDEQSKQEIELLIKTYCGIAHEIPISIEPNYSNT